MARTKQSLHKSHKSSSDGGKKRVALIATQRIPLPLASGKSGKRPPTSLPPSVGGIKKPHRFRPGTVSLREIRKQQKSTEMLLKKAPFNRLVDEIRNFINDNGDIRIAKGGREALQEIAQDELIKVFEGSHWVTIGDPRPSTTTSPTLLPRHMVTALEVTRSHPGDSGYTKYSIYDKKTEQKMARRSRAQMESAEERQAKKEKREKNKEEKRKKEKKQKKDKSAGRDSSITASEGDSTGADNAAF